MDFKEISVNILRLNNQFTVNCREKLGIRDFKEQCRRLSKYPLDKFVLIVEGKEVNENDANCWNTVFNSKRVYVFVQSFFKNDEPEEFIKARRAKKLFEKQSKASFVGMSNKGFFSRIICITGQPYKGQKRSF